MPTLNKTKQETKLIFKWGGILLAVVFIFLMVARFTSLVNQSLTPPSPPQAAFGKLPEISFPNQSKENIKYSLDTLSGFLPSFPDRTKVYKITTNPPTLGALSRTREKVSQTGFTSNETRISQDVYQWPDPTSVLQRKITMNILSSDFTLSSLYLTSQSLQKFTNLDEQNNAIELATSFLKRMSLFASDIDPEKTKITLYSVEKGTLVPISKISNTTIVKVNFFQKSLDGLPIYYEKSPESTISLIIGKENNGLKVVGARYFHKNISDISSTYAIKSTSQAFDELRQGKGYIASKPQNAAEIIIKKASLGYYIGENQDNFLMPIIIFEGDDFLGYVSAVRDEWIDN
ncbi:MAG: hypothetical protein Q7R51_00240 [bacterium]|nr:hypothetical protein [bacterium]